MHPMNDDERISVMAALAVVVLSIAAFVAFILSGSGIPFYALALLAVVAGFYMSYRISQEAKQKQAAPSKPKRAKKAKR